MAAALSPPPPPSGDLCFNPNVFISETYSVDEFFSECRRQVTVEHLHEDLRSYYQTLKTAMIELINKDYSDFLDLSSNLVGMDKEIERLTMPLSQLRQEILNIKSSMDSVIKDLDIKMAARSKLQEKKVAVHRLMIVMESVDLLETLLMNSADINSMSNNELDRIAMEYNKLQYNASLITDIQAIKDLHPSIVSYQCNDICTFYHATLRLTNQIAVLERIGKITDQIQSILEEFFIKSVSSQDHQLLIHTLEIYSLISRHSVAESLFRVSFIRPSLEKIISSKTVLTHPQGISGVYSQVLGVIKKECQFLIEVCDGIQDREGGGAQSGFDFLVNSVWPEIVSLFEAKASLVFAPGNPDNFHKNYVSSMEFMDQFESQCHSLSEVKRFRSHSSYHQFMNKWSLPVYFQIRFQEIASQLESALQLPLEEVKDGDGPYSLQVFVVLTECIASCWSDGIYLSSLVHRFWKLTLQLVVRLGVWLKELLDSQKPLSVTECVKLVTDIESFIDKSNVFSEAGGMKGKLDKISCDSLSLTRAFLQTCDNSVMSLVPRFGDMVISSLTRQCAENLESVQTIPRLFRRTNREVPSKPSGYVSTLLKPVSLINVTMGHGHEWGKQVIENVTEKYHEVTSELLSNVKRTEDSLMKLKRSRRSLIPETSSGMSDDNKIRLQLSIDIEAYISQIHSLLPTVDVSIINKLEEIGRSARTASLSTTAVAD